MSTIRPLPFHVFDSLNRLCARVHSAEDALHVVALFDDGSHVVIYRRNGPTVLVWRKGAEEAMSLTSAIALILARKARGHR